MGALACQWALFLRWRRLDRCSLACRCDSSFTWHRWHRPMPYELSSNSLLGRDLRSPPVGAASPTPTPYNQTYQSSSWRHHDVIAKYMTLNDCFATCAIRTYGPMWAVIFWFWRFRCQHLMIRWRSRARIATYTTSHLLYVSRNGMSMAWWSAMARTSPTSSNWRWQYEDNKWYIIESLIQPVYWQQIIISWTTVVSGDYPKSWTTLEASASQVPLLQAQKPPAETDHSVMWRHYPNCYIIQMTLDTLLASYVKACANADILELTRGGHSSNHC